MTPEEISKLEAHRPFKGKVRRNGDCIEWASFATVRGYGRTNYKGKSVYAHRLSYSLMVGPIPKDKLVCHHCDNPICINPKHLFVGTHKDNAADCVLKGRHFAQRFPHKANIKNFEKLWESRRKKTKCKYGHLFSKHSILVTPPSGKTFRCCVICRDGSYLRRKAIKARAALKEIECQG